MKKSKHPGMSVSEDRLSLVRPEFRRLIKDFNSLTEMAERFGGTQEAISMAISRGGMSEAMARRIQHKTRGKYKAHLLMRKVG